METKTIRGFEWAVLNKYGRKYASLTESTHKTGLLRPKQTKDFR